MQRTVLPTRHCSTAVWTVLLLLFVLLSGCDRAESPVPEPQIERVQNAGSTTTAATQEKANLSPPPLAPSPLLTEPAELTTVEMPGDVLPVWRQWREQRPTLVIFAKEPMLMEIEPQTIETLDNLINQAGPEQFLRGSRLQKAEPVFLPEQTLTAALRHDFFSKVIWVAPPPKPDEEISQETFLKQVQDHGILSADEIASLEIGEHFYEGIRRGTPFQISIDGSLPRLEGPVVVHIDMNFFMALYDSEVRTPIFTLLHDTLSALRITNWPTLVTTLTLATEEGATPLEMRFIKTLLTEIFAEPQRLDADLPEAWDLLREARYLETFFQPERVIDLYLRMEQLRPNDAAVKFDIYRILYTLKDREEAFGYLDRAIALDPGFAVEYLNRAVQAVSKEQYQDALAFLEKAMKLMGDNPFLRMEAVKVMRTLGRDEEADRELSRLRTLPWSPIYYPNIRIALDQLEH